MLAAVGLGAILLTYSTFDLVLAAVFVYNGLAEMMIHIPALGMVVVVVLGMMGVKFMDVSPDINQKGGGLRMKFIIIESGAMHIGQPPIVQLIALEDAAPEQSRQAKRCHHSLPMQGGRC